MQLITGSIDVRPLIATNDGVSGAFTRGAGTYKTQQISVTSNYTGTAVFSSSNSPDARASATTGGQTCENTLGSRFYIRYK